MDISMIIDGNHLIADDGKVLIKDDIIATEVYLGIRDTADEWQEEYAEQIAHTEVLRARLRELEE